MFLRKVTERMSNKRCAVTSLIVSNQVRRNGTGKISSVTLDIRAHVDEELTKKTVDAIHNVGLKSDKLKATLDDKLNTTNQTLADIKQGLADLKQETNKVRSLEFAFQNAGHGSFEYYTAGDRKNSSDLVQYIVLVFRRECGGILPDGYLRYVSSGTSEDEKKKLGKDFRDALVTQLHLLTGIKSRLVFNEEKKQYCVYYS